MRLIRVSGDSSTGSSVSPPLPYGSWLRWVASDGGRVWEMEKSSYDERGESPKRLEYIEGDSDRAAVYVDW
jgi:hypothetical protein